MTTEEINSGLAALRREFSKRLQQLEHEHVMRLMATFQEFKARAAIYQNKAAGNQLDRKGNWAAGK